MTTIVNVVGARPQFIKAGPVSLALKEIGLDEILVHTGQHYDLLLSKEIMTDIGLREPDVNLGVGSASHAVQTAGILEGVETVLVDHKPDAVLTYGDTNSTVAAALAATKMGIFTAHVEAGLRSFNRRMPEEINRLVTDHISDLLFAPTTTAMEHLAAEGMTEKSLLTGDVMVDALQSIDLGAVSLPDWLAGDYYVATIHRAENTDIETRLRGIIESLSRLEHPVHLLAHPRVRDRLNDLSIDNRGSLIIQPPLAYAEMLAALRSSLGLFTDSGGLQKESFILRVPCVTIRTETEWPETFEGSWNVLAGPNDDMSAIAGRSIDESRSEPFGDGTAAKQIARILKHRL